jgi:hypothetical protein
MIIKLSHKFYLSIIVWTMDIGLLFIAIVWQFSRHFSFYEKANNNNDDDDLRWYTTNNIKKIIEISNSLLLEIIYSTSLESTTREKELNESTISSIHENQDGDINNIYFNNRKKLIEFLSNIFSKIVDGHQLAMILSVFQVESNEARDKRIRADTNSTVSSNSKENTSSPNQSSSSLNRSSSPFRSEKNLENLKSIMKESLRIIDKIRVSHFPSFLSKVIDDCMCFLFF